MIPASPSPSHSAPQTARSSTIRSRQRRAVPGSSVALTITAAALLGLVACGSSQQSGGPGGGNDGTTSSGSSSSSSSSSGGGSGGGGSGLCFDYSTWDGTTPAVTFKVDVLPTFQQSCSLSYACHGSQAGPVDRPYLGPAMPDMATDADIQAIFNAIINADAVKANMKIVAPGDPDASFLMHKIDNTFLCEAVSCVAGGCGTSMPQGSPTLPLEKRDAIRRWIAQGSMMN